MCGVIGYVGKSASPQFFYNGLKRLEYRGYDSAGIAMFANGDFAIQRAEGKLNQLEKKLSLMPESTILGIGHTRWATHGKPSEVNAHPHRSGNIVLLHNGIIENYRVIKDFLIKQGYKFVSETDTEVAAHALNFYFKISTEKDPAVRMREAIFKLIKEIKGAYAFAILCAETPDTLYAIKYGSPVVLGKGIQENYLASGISALIEHTQHILFMEDGEIAFLKADGIELFDSENKPIKRDFEKVDWSVSMIEKAGYRHFMLKEIHEQPQAIAETLNGRIERDEPQGINLKAYGIEKLNLVEIDKMHIVACGTSYYSGLVAKYFIEQFAQIPCEVELASEYRYRSVTTSSKTLCVAVSQSGETMDTLQALKHAKSKGASTLAIINSPGSSMAQVAHFSSLIHAGVEVGVASTKAFSAQVASLMVCALAIAQQRKTIKASVMSHVLEELIKAPSLIEKCLSLAENLEKLANKYHNYSSILFIGRGPMAALAYEGALKMKELSYIHAEAYPAGELKHGPIALIDENMPVVCLAPQDSYYEKTMSNIEEIKARGGKILSIGFEGDEELKRLSDDFVEIPRVSEVILPLIAVVPLHLFSYYVAVRKGTDVDQPRNLAKSVTVE